jgi:hypothetical protein
LVFHLRNLSELTRKTIADVKKNMFSWGKIIKVTGNEFITGFDRKLNMPAKGITLQALREYKRPLGVKTGINIKRVIDLDKALKYYRTVQEWIKKIDTTEYFDSYREYKDLKQGFWKAPTCDFLLDLWIEIKVIEVYDSTALARITYKKYPWTELEVGDFVKLK